MTEQTGNNKPNEAEGLAFPLSGNEKLIDSVRDWPTITRMSHSTQLEKLVELRDALEAAEKALTPTDDERAVFDAIADRLGEHSQARNFEIADSGEYETKLRGPVDVEVLAEWLLPTVLGFCRSEVREPSAERIGCNICGEALPDGEPHLCSEPQGEPSDAQVNAASREIDLRGFHIPPMAVRAALRAAGGVR